MEQQEFNPYSKNHKRNSKKSTIKKSSTIPSIMFIILITGVGLLAFYQTLEKPLEKALVLLIGLSIFIPFLITMVQYLLSSGIKTINKADRNSKYTRKVDGNGKLITKEEWAKRTQNPHINSRASHTVSKTFKNETTKYSSKGKEVATEGYMECRNIITASSKNKLMKREVVLDFKAEIRNHLRSNYEAYKNMHFENDMHEIYVLIKSSKLTPQDYKELTEWLSSKLIFETNKS